MGLFKKRGPSLYEIERAKIQHELSVAKPGTDEYRKLLEDLNSLRKFTGEEKEMKQFLDKDGRKTVIGKLLGFAGIGALIFGLTKFEKVDGNMLSGSNKDFGGGLIRSAFKLFG